MLLWRKNYGKKDNDFRLERIIQLLKYVNPVFWGVEEEVSKKNENDCKGWKPHLDRIANEEAMVVEVDHPRRGHL